METRRTLPSQVKVEKSKAGKIVQDVGRESGERVQWELGRQGFQKRGDQHPDATKKPGKSRTKEYSVGFGIQRARC